jgi:glycosyltransferase involved in cell wall biosynthesis
MKSTLRVAVAGWLLGPASGANRRLLALLAEIGPRLLADERVTVLHRPDYAPPALPGIDWRPLAIPALPTMRRVRAERRLLAPALRAMHANVLDHGFLPLPDVPIPVCLLVHDVRRLETAPTPMRAAARWLLRSSLRRAAAVVTPSAWTQSRLRELVPNLSPIVIANGVAEVSPVASAPPPVPVPAHGYLLHVGHVEARKNLDVVIAALAQLAPSERPELWLAGADHGARAHLTAAAAAKAVVLRAFGTVDEAQLPALYANALAVVMPSRHEGFGLPALEGLAHGRPVLVASGSALPEVVGDAGVVLPPDDARAWAMALRHLADDASSRTVRRRRAGQLSWHQPAEQLLVLWRSLATQY